MTQRTRIQTELINRAKAGKFFEVSYNKTTKVPNNVDILTAPVIEPSAVFCNEIEQQFGVDRKYGRDLKLKSVSWVFDLLVEFSNKEVTDEVFKKSLSDSVPLLANDQANDFEAVMLVLIAAVYEHPVTQQPSTGTKIRYTFRVLGEH